MMERTALAKCEICGMPVRIDFNDNGDIMEVFAVCSHPEAETRSYVR